MRKLLGILFISLGGLIILSLVDPQLHAQVEPLFFPILLGLAMISAMISTKRVQLIPSLILLGSVLWVLRELNIVELDRKSVV